MWENIESMRWKRRAHTYGLPHELMPFSHVYFQTRRMKTYELELNDLRVATPALAENLHPSSWFDWTDNHLKICSRPWENEYGGTVARSRRLMNNKCVLITLSTRVRGGETSGLGTTINFLQWWNDIIHYSSDYEDNPSRLNNYNSKMMKSRILNPGQPFPPKFTTSILGRFSSPTRNPRMTSPGLQLLRFKDILRRYNYPHRIPRVSDENRFGRAKTTDGETYLRVCDSLYASHIGELKGKGGKKIRGEIKTVKS